MKSRYSSPCGATLLAMAWLLLPGHADFCRAQSAYCSMAGHLSTAGDTLNTAFSVPITSNMTFRTWSYSGGTNSAGQSVPSGGIDSVLTLLNSSNMQIAQSDDYAIFTHDSRIITSLSAGTYSLQLGVASFGAFGDGHWSEDVVNSSGSLNLNAISGAAHIDTLILGAAGPAVASMNFANSVNIGTVQIHAGGQITIPAGGGLRGSTLNVVGGNLNQSGGGVLNFASISLDDAAVAAVASVTIDELHSVFVNGGSSLTVAGRVFIGGGSAAVGQLNVTGPGSRLLVSGDSPLGIGSSSGIVAIHQGGVATFSSSVVISGFINGASPNLTVDTGSTARFHQLSMENCVAAVSGSTVLVDGQLSLGTNSTTLSVSGGTIVAGAGANSAGRIDLTDAFANFGAGLVTSAVVSANNSTIVGPISGAVTSQLVVTNHSTLAASTGTLKASKIHSLLIGGLLDIANNAMVLNYDGTLQSPDPFFTIRSHIIAGRNGGSWNGIGGITSSTAAANRNAPHPTAIGYAEASSIASSTFLGQSVDGSAVLFRYTFAGDANLDGQVDVTDLGALATNWQTSSFWSGGDFNYDGFVDVTDLGALATNWQQGVGSPLAPSQLDEALASVGLANVAVPEPELGAMIALWASCSQLQRGRSRRLTTRFLQARTAD